MARNIEAVPTAAEDAELPARGVGDLDHEAAVGREQFARGNQVPARVVEVLEDVKHRHAGQRAGAEGRALESGANRGRMILFPRERGGFAREVEADHPETAPS